MGRRARRRSRDSLDSVGERVLLVLNMSLSVKTQVQAHDSMLEMGMVG